MSLRWEGTYGYGDMIGAVTNAMWRLKEFDDNELSLIWYMDRKWWPPSDCYHPDDPESTVGRIDYIIKAFKGTHKLDIEHEFYPTTGERYVNRYKSNQWWATMWDTVIEPTDDGSIVVWWPFENVDDIASDPGMSYKSPLDRETWERVLETLRASNRRIEFVNYRMPIAEVFEKISRASLCIGYEGIGQLIAKNFWKPMITYSNQKKLSHVTGGPWTLIDNKYNHRILSNIDGVIREQKPKIDHCKEIYEHRQSGN